MTTSDDTSDIKKERLLSLIEFSRQTVGTRKDKAASIAEYRLLEHHEHQLVGLPGVSVNVDDPADEIWLNVQRLHFIDPPQIDDPVLQPWIEVPDNPGQEPFLKEETDGESLILSGTHRSPLDTDNESLPEVELDEIIPLSEFDLEDLVKSSFETYVSEQWLDWATEEGPRRNTIRVYNGLYQLAQQLEVSTSEAQLELVWGVGLAIWNYEGTQVRYPIIGQLVELSLDSNTFEIKVSPRRNADPELEVDWASETNPGVGGLIDEKKEFFDNAETTFSPFEPETFETVLRSAVTNLDPNGIYWPNEVNPENRSLPRTDDRLKITDTWVIFARPRTNNIFIQDLNRLEEKVKNTDVFPAAVNAIATDPDESIPEIELPNFRGVTASYGIGNEGSNSNERELYFPKPFNDEQVRIIQRLEVSDGVVVQGPPGTGKTHTIANVICHYLAQGKRVLVTSMKDPALAVLQNQLPKEIQPLAISLLTSEREGMKQFEFAINKIASEVQGIDRTTTARDIENVEKSIDGLHAQIAVVDRRVQELALKHFTDINIDDESIEPREAALQLIASADDFAWFPDPLGISPEFAPQFSNEDIVRLREERQILGPDIDYLDISLPQLDGFPDPGELLRAHQDLSRVERLTKEIEAGKVPELTDSSPEVLALAQQLLSHMEETQRIRTEINERNLQWTDPLREKLRSGISSEVFNLLEILGSDLESARESQHPYLAKPVTLPNGYDLDSEFVGALEKLSQGKNPFGITSMFGGKSTLKRQVAEVQVIGNRPNTDAEWKHVLAFVQVLKTFRELTIRWNALAQELQLGTVEGTPFESVTAAIEAYALYTKLKGLVEAENQVPGRVARIFPTWTNTHEIVNDTDQQNELENSLRHHLTRGHLANSWAVKERLQTLVAGSPKGILVEIQDFSVSILGNPAVPDPQMQSTWSGLLGEVNRILDLEDRLSNVKNICAKIKDSGALQYSIWLQQPVQTLVDNLLPNNLLDVWRLQRLATYLDSIDAHYELKELAETRTQLETDLSHAYEDVVVKRTWLALMENASPSVRQGLTAFLTAIRRIGRGTGKRAVRYRHDAREAANQANHAVPCWIMPHYRVSESLPAELGVFDLVVIDEASQSDLTALPSLLRAQKVLIVGDDKQVQPEGVGLREDYIKNLMENHLGNHVPIYSAQMSPDRSIYDLFQVVFTTSQVMLKEHFRCVDPIIEYSKREFYNHELIPLRLPTASERLDPPLVDVLVEDGNRRGDQNRPEARFIVDEIKAIANDPNMAGRSIGVVSLLAGAQPHHIWQQLSRELGLDLMERHQITCGDARMFQGKERDIMFLSMVAAPGNGRIAPLTRDTFERSFNVAASRARDRMYLVRSVNPDDLSDTDRLRRSLIEHFDAPFAQDEFRVEELRDLCESDFERDVYDELTKRGYLVTPQVKVGPYRIDMVVEDIEDNRLAIECDGDRHHGPEKWLDDMRREGNIRRAGKGWGQFWRCFASEFTRHRDDMVEDLLQTLADRGIEPIGAEGASLSRYVEHRVVRTTADENAPQTSSDVETSQDIFEQVQDVIQGPNKPKTVENVPVVDRVNREHIPIERSKPLSTQTRQPEQENLFGSQTITPDSVSLIDESNMVRTKANRPKTLEEYIQVDLDSFPRVALLQDANANILVPMMVEIAKTEGPVHENILLRRIRTKFNRGKLVGSTRDHVKKILSGAVSGGNINRMGEFYVTDSAQAANAPRDRGDRDIDEIAPRELTLVVKNVQQDRPSLDRDRVIREVANRFGFRRVTEKLDNIIAKLLDE
jgi:very-short-patch-repair endonuclease